MPFPTTNAKQELPAINQILTSCGQAPVTTLDQTNPEVAIAYDTLLQVSREVQSEGWTFNREYHYTDITPDVNKEILIPNNIIQIKLSEDSQNTSHDGIRRSGKLYDRQNHTYQWDYNPAFDIIWYFDWVDLPDPIQTYITARASTLVSGKIVGDDDQYARLQQQEALARSSAMEYETSQGQFTMFGHPQGQQNYYQSYQPFHALQR